MGFYEEMIRRIAADADPVAVIEEIRIYTNWVLVKTGKWSLSTYFRGMPGFTEAMGMGTWMGNWIGRPAREAALELLASREILKRSVGMACLKSLLPEPAAAIAGGAIELVASAAACMPTCFIGYFKTAALWREQGNPVTIVELFPRPGDISWDEADEVLRKAELVLMTGLTVVNETLEAVIRRTPSARLRILMGPTVPASTALFDYGIDVLGSPKKACVLIENIRGRGGVIDKRFYCPVGLSIGRSQPQEIALSIMAEVILICRGGSLTHLRRDWTAL